MTPKPILRVGKIKKSGKTTLHSVAGHLDRSRHTPNADPSRLKLNEWLIGSSDLTGHVDALMRKHGLDPAKTRKDAVVANDMLLTVSPEWFRPEAPDQGGTWDENRLRVFRAEATAMLRKTFGSRVVAAVLHLDESTPHVQAVVVPLLKDEKGVKLTSKAMFGPEQLTALQQGWEDRMAAHGVGVRTKHSRATHTTLREYYGALENYVLDHDFDQRAELQVSAPPERKFLEGKDDHAQRVKDWQKAETKRLRDELRPLSVEAAKGRLYEREKNRNDFLAGGRHFDKVQLDQVSKELALTKDKIDRLRSTPINEVAIALGHTGPVGPKENPIDLTMRVGELSFAQATAWLGQRFGQAAAVGAAMEMASESVREAPGAVFTAGERVKARIVKEQLHALAAPSYRVTAMHVKENGESYGVNIGKRVYDRDELTSREVINLIPELTKENARGGNIYITPIDPAVEHVLVDDLDAAGRAEMDRKGYTPAMVVESSPGSFQAVLKVPRNEGDKADRNEVFKDLNRAYGDEKITGLSHPFRLGGFENRKAKHQQEDGKFPFVRVVEAVNRLCTATVDLVRTYQAQREAHEAQKAAEAARRAEEQRKAEEARAAAYKPRGPRM